MMRSRLLGLRGGQRALSVHGRGDPVSFPAQVIDEHAQDVRFVIHDQDLCVRHLTFRVKGSQES